MPSGRTHWPHFLPLLGAAVVVSACMAYALFLAEARLYLAVLTPALLTLPVLLTLTLAVYFGRCRSPLLAGATGALLALLYYGGYWLFSYRANVVAMGQFGSQMLQRFAGRGGLLGYVLLRARLGMNGMLLPEGSPLIIAHLAYRGLELGAIVAAGMFVGRRVARRAYFEDHGHWASSTAFLFNAVDLSRVMAIVSSQDWAGLDAVEKRPVTAGERRHGGMLFRLEYLPRATDQPAYVTVEGPVLRRAKPLLAVLPVLGRWVRRWVDQQTLDQESLARLARHMGGIDVPALPAPVPVAAAGAGWGEGAPAVTVAGPSGALGYWSADQRVQSMSTTRGLASMLGETGMFGGSVGDSPQRFLEPAVAATLAMLGRWPDSGLAGVEGVPASLTSQAEEDPRRALRRLSAFDLTLSFVMFGCCIAGSIASVVSRSLQVSADAHGAAVAGFTARGLWLVAAAAVFLLVFAQRPLAAFRLRRRFARRPGSLLPRPPSSGQRVQVLRLEDAATFHISKMAPEDWCLCVHDPARRRLLLEGVSHRHLIRGEDVTDLRPVPTGSSMAAFLRWRVNGQVDVGIALALPSTGYTLLYALSRYPVIGFPFRPLAALGGRRFARRLGQTLGVAPAGLQ